MNKTEKSHTNSLASKNRLQANTGITLVVLVITIVVLLILAGVSITVLFGENKIISSAQDAAEKTNSAVINELEQLENIIQVSDKYGNGGEKDDPGMPTGWDKSKVTAITSEDGKTVPVPKGFVASEVNRKVTIDGKEIEEVENKVSEGFVIYQGTDKVDNTNVETERTSRNQFVWVPYDTFKTAYPMFAERMEGETATTVSIGQLYDYDTTAKTAIPMNAANQFTSNRYREPDILIDITNGDAIEGNSAKGIEQLKNVIGITSSKTDETEKNVDILAKWKEQLKDEFNEMMESVKRYGGFYIGRYELGKEGTTAVVKRNKDVCINENWYSLYQKCKTVANNSDIGVTSSMIWGCQWDAALNWFVSQNGNKKDYVFDSTGKGNFNGSLLANGTGSIEDYQINNIYDMIGNVWDWTIEADNTYERVSRGGTYDRTGNGTDAFCRSNGPPSNFYNGSGSRATLIF